MKVKKTKISQPESRERAGVFHVFILVAFPSDAPVTFSSVHVFSSDVLPLKSVATLLKRGRQTGNKEGGNETHEKKAS